MSTRGRCVPVADGDGPAAVDAMRALGIRGLSVTMPHKEAVLAAADRRAVQVEALAAATVDQSTTAWSPPTTPTVMAWFAAFGSRTTPILRVLAWLCSALVVRAFGDRGARSGGRSRRGGRESHPGPRRERCCARWPRRGVGSVDAIGEADIVINATSVGMDGVSSPSPGGSFARHRPSST